MARFGRRVAAAKSSGAREKRVMRPLASANIATPLSNTAPV
jgi:hypothetical protein